MTQTGVTISGHVEPGFETVRDVFVENFKHRKELGAACCVYHRGEKVVDLWGGIRNKATSEPWERDTMALVFSATKGMTGLAMALAESRGLFDYDELVSKYWPEFAQNGKEKITVRQLFAHQAGLHAFDAHVDRSVVADLDRLADVMAHERPEWPPGERQAYHAISLGFYQSELLRRVDPKHRTVGQYFQDEIASPLSLSFYIRLPEDIPNSRLAPLEMYNPIVALFNLPIASTLGFLTPHSHLRRALSQNPGSLLPLDKEHVYARNLQVPSGGGVGTARAIARAYGEFANGGKNLGLREETLKELMAPAVPSLHGFYDECFKLDVHFSLGFMKPSGDNPFGHPGAGGSMGFADPEAGIGYGYVPNRMLPRLQDPRDHALRTAVYRSIGVTDPYHARGQEEMIAN